MKPSNISNQRIMTEVKKLNNQKLSYLTACPLPDDLYTWHFTIQGPQNTQFHEGLYHGQILLPYEYPFKPPDIVFMNKNGRFETNTKICLTITQYHPQQWNSAWTIRTMLEAVISLFAQNVQGVGYLASTSQVRSFLAKSSHSYVCEKCGLIKDTLAPRPPRETINKSLIQNGAPNAQEPIQRKFSEGNNLVIPTSLNTIVSQNLNLMSKKKRDTTKASPSRNQDGQKGIKQRVIYEKQHQQNVEDQSKYYPFDQTILVKDNNYQAREQMSFRLHSKQIQKNIKLLDRVYGSIKWVD